MRQGRYAFYGLSLTISDDSGQATIGSGPDPLELQTALELVHFGDRVLVAGGGMGGTSLLLAGAVGRTNVVTYEANPYLANLARRNARMQGKQLDIRHGALGTYTGEVELHVSVSMWGSSVLPDRAGLPGTIGSIRVPCVDINDVLRTERCNGMLLDVEGAEMDILPHLDFDLLDFLAIELHGSPKQIEVGTEYIARAMTITIEHLRGERLVVLGAVRRDSVSPHARSPV